MWSNFLLANTVLITMIQVLIPRHVYLSPEPAVQSAVPHVATRGVRGRPAMFRCVGRVRCAAA